MNSNFSTQTYLGFAALIALIVASFATVGIQWGELFSAEAFSKARDFLGGFSPPDFSAEFVQRVLQGAWETLAMSIIGTALAVVLGLLLALPAVRHPEKKVAQFNPAYWLARGVLNALRSIPELVWASLLIISAGLGPFAGTLALALHTAGVLGRLFAESFENAPPAPAAALRNNGASAAQVFLYATLPQALAQMLSYTLYRWENNIRAAAVLGVVGAGGLGQMMYYHLSLFQTQQVATVLLAMLLLVGLVDAASFAVRSQLTR